MSTDEPRVVIARRLTRLDRLHGAWWPRSSDLDQELAPMLAVVAPRLGPVLGVMLNRDEWTTSRETVQRPGPGRMWISWYGLTEPHLVVLHCDRSRRVALLLLPPDTPERVALTATLMASTPGNVLTPDETLVLARHRSAVPSIADGGAWAHRVV